MKKLSYNIFRQRLHNRARNKGSLLRVMFELTYRCNFYCPHCYVPLRYRKYKELKTEEIFSILDQLADLGCFYLGFTGGEPFVRKDIMKILHYAKQKGFQLIIYTNGFFIDAKIAKELASLRPNKVDITIPAMSKESFERITGVPGSHKKVFNAIDFLYKRGVNLGFKSCVLKGNEKEIEDIRRFAGSLGAFHRLDDMFMPRLDGSKQPYKYRGQITDDRGENRLSVLGYRLSEKTECQKANTEHRTPNTDNLFRCGVGVSQTAITPLGELKMCLMIDYPKYKIATGRRSQVTGSRLKDVWERLKRLVTSIKPDKNYRCPTCEVKEFCKWCPAKAWLYNKSFTSCDEESYKRAKLLKGA